MLQRMLVFLIMLCLTLTFSGGSSRPSTLHNCIYRTTASAEVAYLKLGVNSAALLTAVS